MSTAFGNALSDSARSVAGDLGYRALLGSILPTWNPVAVRGFASLVDVRQSVVELTW